MAMARACAATLTLAMIAAFRVDMAGKGHRTHMPFVQARCGGSAHRVEAARIERLGSWWVCIGGRVYSPALTSNIRAHSRGARVTEPALLEENAVSNAWARSTHGFYVAIGSNLPPPLARARVGGDNRYHIVYLPNATSTQLRAIVRFAQAGVSIGDRRRLHALHRLQRGFTPTHRFELGDDYENPLDQAGQSLEKATVAMLSEAQLHSDLSDLVGFGSRASGGPTADRVQAYIQSRFQNMGYITCLQPVSGLGSGADNVIAMLPGKNKAKQSLIVVGAHFDSRPFSGPAPGAEDNGSGAAALLSIAAAFSQAVQTRKLSNSVVFIAFTGEEQGLYGSKEFVGHFGQWPNACKIDGYKAAAERTGDTGMSNLLTVSSTTEGIRAAIIMDEIGWASPDLAGHTATLETRNGDATRALMRQLGASNRDHNGENGLVLIESLQPFGSDHMPFLDAGVPSVLTINGNDEAYPYYHQATDTIDHVDTKLMLKVARMNLGALMRLAFA